MSLNELDIISDENSRLENNVGLIKKYLSSAKIKLNDEILLDHMSYYTHINKDVLIKILDKGIKHGLFEEVSRYNCSKSDKIIGKLKKDCQPPFEAFCDECISIHVFNKEDIKYSYKFLIENETIQTPENGNENEIKPVGTLQNSFDKSENSPSPITINIGKMEQSKFQ